MQTDLRENRTPRAILLNMLIAAVSLFVNGFGVYLTIQANIGAGPWDVLNLGLSRSLGILYGNASITVSLSILAIDILLKEPIGIAMFIDAVVVGKAVDFFNWIHAVPACDSLWTGIPVMVIGLFILAYTQYTYMIASLGCGPRDTLLVGLAKRAKRALIGAVSIALLSTATLIGWLLGGPVGVGTLICAFGSGPVMQLAFATVHFDATHVRHQRLKDSAKVLAGAFRGQEMLNASQEHDSPADFHMDGCTNMNRSDVTGFAGIQPSSRMIRLEENTMKSRTAQLIFQSIYVSLALVACVGSVGFYDMKFTSDFYIYFTNISNYLCAGVMIAELIQTARKPGDSYVTTAPRLRVISMLGLVLTFLVFNLLLANDPARDPALNYKVECILCHIVLPILFVADWVMFYEHGKINWKLPLLSALFPLFYLLYVLLHAALWRFDSSIMNYAGTDPIIYPYFFLNPERVGAGGIILWVAALLAGFVALGYLFMLADRLLRKQDSRNHAG